jgi:integrase
VPLLWLVCCYSACSPFEAVSGRNHSEMWAGCIASLTTPTRLSFSVSRSVSSRRLRWDDVDLERRTLRVGRALVREGSRHTLGETKTKRGPRQINLTPRTVNALKAHRKNQLEGKMRLAVLYKDHGLIFASEVGTPLNPENLVKRSFKPLLKRASLPEIRFHDLRHTCATLLLGRGVHPKLVQELLGHATIAMTLDTYSHYLPSMGDQAARTMGDALG